MHTILSSPQSTTRTGWELYDRRPELKYEHKNYLAAEVRTRMGAIGRCGACNEVAGGAGPDRVRRRIRTRQRPSFCASRRARMKLTTAACERS